MIRLVNQAESDFVFAATPLNLQGTDRFDHWEINLSSIARIDENGTRELLTPANLSLSVIPDTGSPNIYLPPSIVRAMTSTLNITLVQPSPSETFLYVACSLRSSKTAFEFAFPGRKGTGGAVGNGGPRIKVPLADIIYRFGDPANIGEVRNEEGVELCYLGLNAIEGPIRLLGATMLRSAYIVFDAENLEIRMAQARWDY